MRSITRAQHRVLAVAAAAVLAVPGSALLGGTAYAGTDGPSSSGNAHEVKTTPQEPSNADYSGHGANQHGPYDSTRDGSPSGNGNGKGEAKGKPCAGCVGKADNKNPKGQQPGGSDHNAGYECDRNHGIGRTNPAHTGCRTTDTAGEGTGTTGGSNDGDSSGAPECTGDMTDVEGTDCTPAPECTDQSGTDQSSTEESGTGDAVCVPAEGEGEGGSTPGTGVEGTGVEGTGTGTDSDTGVSAPAGPEVKGVSFTRTPSTAVRGQGATRVLASTLPFTGSHVDELLVASVLLLVSGVAVVTLGRRREV